MFEGERTLATVSCRPAESAFSASGTAAAWSRRSTRATAPAGDGRAIDLDDPNGPFAGLSDSPVIVCDGEACSELLKPALDSTG